MSYDVNFYLKLYDADTLRRVALKDLPAETFRDLEDLFYGQVRDTDLDLDLDRASGGGWRDYERDLRAWTARYPSIAVAITCQDEGDIGSCWRAWFVNGKMQRDGAVFPPFDFTKLR